MTAVVLVVVAVLAVANWWSRWRDIGRLELVTKPLATASVIALAVVRAASTEAPGGVLALYVAALVLCLAGDVALLPAVDRFVAGLAAFLLGHVLFVAGLVADGLREPALAVPAVVLVGGFVATVGRRIVAGARAGAPELAAPVTAYLLVISSMVVVAWATGEWPAAVGATAFVTSDALLGWGRFVRSHRWTAVSVMMTYHVALVGLAWSVG